MSGYYDLLLRILLRASDGIIFYFILTGALSLLFLLVAIREFVRFRRAQVLVDENHLLQSEETPPVSVLCPVFNCGETVAETVQALLRLHYPRFEVVVINDGSTDDTLKRLKNEFKLVRTDFLHTPEIPTRPVREMYRSMAFPRLTVVDKQHGGRADAFNAGLSLARHALFASVDTETRLVENALLKAVYPFVRWKDKVAAARSNLLVANGCRLDQGRVVQTGLPRRFLPLYQIIESLRLFATGRMPWNAFNAVVMAPGAFCIYRKDLVMDAGGFDIDAVDEDMELTLRLQRHMRDSGKVKAIYLLPHAVCWAMAPVTLGDLGRRQSRQQRGLMDTLGKHKGMFLRPRYGAIGMMGLPYLLLFEVLSPLVELAGYAFIGTGLALGMVQLNLALLFLAATLGFGLFTSLCSLLIEEALFRRFDRTKDLLLLIWVAFMENFGYRQISMLIRFSALLGFSGRKKKAEI